MWGNYSSIVWSVPNSQFDELMGLTDEQFVDKLNETFLSDSLYTRSVFQKYLHAEQKIAPPYVTFRITKIEKLCNKRLSFPLSTANCSKYVEHKTALIGDAAHSIHPMAGQGLNLGLLDANILANVVCKAVADGATVGNEDYLMEYEALAKKNNYLMQTNLEFVKMSYGLRARPFSVLRNLGIDIINRTPVKDVFMSFADGDWYEETRRLYINP